jgi:hypothetical protein
MGMHIFYEVACDNPKCTEVVRYSSSALKRVIEYMRKDGWSVSRDRKHCYCPSCAVGYRSVGRSGVQGNFDFHGYYPPPEN